MGLDDILKRLNAGEFDGAMYDRFGDHGTITEYKIKDGVPTRTYHGKTQRFFNGKENETWNKVEKEVFDTDTKKKEFIERFGFIGELFGYDDDAKKVSGDYYKRRKEGN